VLSSDVNRPLMGAPMPRNVTGILIVIILVLLIVFLINRV